MNSEFNQFLASKRINENPLKIVEKVLFTEVVLKAIKAAGLPEIKLENAMILMELKSQPLFFNRISKEAQLFLRGLSLYKKASLTQSQWIQDIQFYRQIPQNLRYYDVDSSGHITTNKQCKIGTKRGGMLWGELYSIAEGKNKQRLNFLTTTTDDTEFIAKIESNGRYRYELKKIPSHYQLKGINLAFEEEKYEIKAIPKKKYAVLEESLNDKMRSLLNSISDEMGSRPLMKLDFVEDKVSEIKLDKVHHFVGALGVGKTNFKLLFTKHLIDNNLLNRVAIVENSVSAVFDIVKSLRKYGVNAIPVVGKNEEKQLNDYLATLKNGLMDTIDDEIIEFIGGNCVPEDIIATMPDSHKYEKRNYCDKFKEKDTMGCICPYISICGKMKRYREMRSSPVWVISSAALISTTIPAPFNPKKQSMFEIVYDCCDLVFIDEVDGVQKYFDEALVEEKTMFESKALVSDLKKLEIELKNSKANGPEISNLYHCISNFEKAINHFNDFAVISRYSINKLAEEKMITPKNVVREILTHIEPNKQLEKDLKSMTDVSSVYRYDKEVEKEIIKAFNKNPIYIAYKMFNAMNHVSYYLIEEKYEALFSAIDDYCESFNVVYKSDVPTDLGLLNGDVNYNVLQKLSEGRYRKVKAPVTLGGSLKTGLTLEEKVKKQTLVRELLLFLIILIEIDHNYKQIVLNCEVLRGKDDVEEESSLKTSHLSELSLFKNPTSLFTYEELIENNMGYSLKKMDVGDFNYELEYKEYTGVGRQLIHHLNFVKEPLGLKGPGVIGLSGTSYLPMSPHFHFNTPVSVLLRSINEDGSNKNDGRIDMEYLMISSKKKGYVHVSGSGKDKQRRNTAYREIIESDRFKTKLRKTLEETGKKAIIVVASYEDAITVQALLNKEGFSTICLIQEGQNSSEESYTSIYKSEVEQIAFNEEYRGKDCFIVGAKTIYRGYNILDEQYNSYFGSAFFLYRPYTPPFSYKNAVTVTHAFDEEYMNEYLQDVDAKSKQFLYYDSIRAIKNQEKFDRAYEMGKWSDLSDEERLAVSAEAFSYIKQMIGRLQRGQNDCKVFFVDAAFCEERYLRTINTPEGESMFDYWKFLIENAVKENKKIGSALYQGFYEALIEMMENIHARNF